MSERREVPGTWVWDAVSCCPSDTAPQKTSRVQAKRSPVVSPSRNELSAGQAARGPVESTAHYDPLGGSFGNAVRREGWGGTREPEECRSRKHTEQRVVLTKDTHRLGGCEGCGVGCKALDADHVGEGDLGCR